MTSQFRSFAELRKQIGHALDGHGYVVKRKGPRLWRIDHDGASPRHVDVELHEGWLCFREPLSGAHDTASAIEVPGAPDAPDAWTLVSAPLFSASRGRVAMDPGDGGARLREDVPLGDGLDLSVVCRDAVSGFATARSALAGVIAGSGKPSKKRKSKTGGDVGIADAVATADSVAAADTEAPADTFEDLCADAGWTWSQRGDGTPVAALDVPAGIGARQAVLAAGSEGDYRVTVELNRFTSPCGDVRLAAAVFLLTINDLIRFARARAADTDKGIKTFLEVCFFERPSAVLFDEALCALSVGVRFCDRELRALGEAGVARSYLKIRGMSPNGQDPSRGRVSVNNPDRREVSHV